MTGPDRYPVTRAEGEPPFADLEVNACPACGGTGGLGAPCPACGGGGKRLTLVERPEVPRE
jgi:DnaJ-class molecular chaperone